MRNRRKIVGVALLGLAVLVLSGCNKLSKSNYDKIQNGMTSSQVEDILGQGTEKAGAGAAVGNLGGSAKVITWGDEKKSVTVTFVNDKVVLKAEQGL